jgi:glutamyl-tRNA synthetase
MQYRDEGYLPEALLNYLARLGWSHGNEEKFDQQQFVGWFDLPHISKSPARFDPEKLTWLNAQHLKEADDERLAELTMPYPRGPTLSKVIALMKGRVGTVKELAEAAVFFYRPVAPSHELKREYLSDEIRIALLELRQRFSGIVWTRANINDKIKSVLNDFKLKLPKIAMPLRVAVTGTTQTPSIDATLELIGRDEVLSRMDQALAS